MSPDEPQPTQLRLQRTALPRILLVQTVFGVGFSAFLLLPKFLSEQGVSARMIGAISASMSFSVVLAAPLSAWLLGRLDRIVAMRLGVTVLGLSSLSFFALSESGFAMLALRAVQGIAFSLLLSASAALVVEITPTGRLGRILGYLGATMLASQAIAPAIVEPLIARLGWKMLFASGAAFALLALLLTLGLRISQVSRAAGLPSGAQSNRSGVSLFVRTCLVASCATGFAFGAVATFVPAYGKLQGVESISGLFLGYTLCALGVRTFGAGVGDTLGHGRIAVASLVVYGLVLLGFVDLNPTLLPVLGGGLGLAHGLLYPSLNAMALSLVSPERRAGVQAYFFGSFHLGVGMSGLILGALVSSLGFGGIFIVASACNLSAAGVLVWGLRVGARGGPMGGIEAPEPMKVR